MDCRTEGYLRKIGKLEATVVYLFTQVPEEKREETLDAISFVDAAITKQMKRDMDFLFHVIGKCQRSNKGSEQ